MSDQKPSRNNVGLVFSGGGARGAYEAGAFYYLRQQLAQEISARRFSVYSGTSVGAINTCIAASTAEDHLLQAAEMKRLWYDIEPGDVYARNIMSLGRLVRKGIRGMTANLFRGVSSSKTHFSGLLDTRPLYARLCRDIPFHNIRRNIDAGYLDACCVTATNLKSGQAELFFEKNHNTRYTGDYIHHNIRLQPIHPMASAAIPIVFPAIGLLGHHYVDGGLRLNTPLSPAIQLGAKRIMVIGVQHMKTQASTFVSSGQVTLGEVLSRVFNGIFLDKVRSDVDQAQRINRIIEWGEGVYGQDFIEQINRYIKEHKIEGDIANRGLQKLDVFRLTPSQDLGTIFYNYYQNRDTEDFTVLERTLTRLLDVDPNSGYDFLSYMTFSKQYIRALFELGFEDCKAQQHSIEQFLARD